MSKDLEEEMFEGFQILDIPDSSFLTSPDYYLIYEDKIISYYFKKESELFYLLITSTIDKLTYFSYQHKNQIITINKQYFNKYKIISEQQQLEVDYTPSLIKCLGDAKIQFRYLFLNIDIFEFIQVDEKISNIVNSIEGNFVNENNYLNLSSHFVYSDIHEVLFFIEAIKNSRNKKNITLDRIDDKILLLLHKVIDLSSITTLSLSNYSNNLNKLPYEIEQLQTPKKVMINGYPVKENKNIIRYR